MVNFQNAKVYRIWSPTRPDLGCYIGATCNSLRQRLAEHKNSFQRYQSGVNKQYYSSYEILAVDDAQIELIENCPCESRDQLNAREGHFIRTMDCVNKVVPDRTKAEYNSLWYSDHRDYALSRRAEKYTSNRERELAWHAEYRAKNRDAINAKQREKVTCQICNCQVSRNHMERHRTSQKHLRNLANQQPTDLEQAIADLTI